MAAPALYIRSERAGAAWQVWPEPELVPPGIVQETGNYLFELKDAPDAAGADLFIDEQPLEALRIPAPNAARWRWSPGFHAGTIEAELRIPGHAPRRFEVITDADSRKLTRDAFDAMVREILEDTFALFSLSSFRKSIARGAGTKPPAIARLEFLRSRIAELEAIAASIRRLPRHTLSAASITLPYYRVRKPTGPEILKSFRSGRFSRETASPRLPAALQGYLPRHIEVQQRLSSFNLPEHRQMAACLRSWAAWLGAAVESLERALPTGDGEQQRLAASWIARCKRLARRVSAIAAASPFAEAGEAPARLTLSALFRNDPRYRRFYQLWRDMNLGIAAIFGDFLNLPLARTFELYELWCFLRLVRAAVGAFGPAGVAIGDLFITDAAGGVTLATGAVTVSVGSGWKLCFQRQYREFWTASDREGSFSRVMAPDIVAARSSASASDRGRVIVLDAKYRIGEGLNDALSSIHTYRDALVREVTSGDTEGIVTAAYLLTPYVPELTPSYRDTPMPGRLFHPDYRTGFQFGAVTFVPGMTVAEIADALATIVADATAAS